MTQFLLGVLFVLLVLACIWQYKVIPPKLRSFSEWLGLMIIFISPLVILMYTLSK